MDKNNDSQAEKYYSFFKEMYDSIKDANKKLDHIIQNLREVYHTPLRCPFYDPHLYYKNNKDNHTSDYL